LWRLWTQDPSPFWRAHGFQEADANALEKLPPRFGRQDNGWFTLQLRDEVSPEMSLEHEFEMFKQSRQEWTQRKLRQARVLKVLAIMVAVALFGVAGWLLLQLMRGLPTGPKPKPKPAREQPKPGRNEGKAREK